MSPAWSAMLFLVSPDSINSLRLMVVVLARGGGTACAEELDAAIATEARCCGAAFCEPEEPALGDVCASTPVACLAGSCSGPISGGSAASGLVSCAGRETITVSPA